MATDPKLLVTAMLSEMSEMSGVARPSEQLGPSADRLFPLIYDELRRLAAGYMRGESSGHSLQPTALVNEAYLRMVDLSRIDWRGRTHFFAVGARVMRRVLVDHARAKGSQKRGGDWHRVTLSHAPRGYDLDGLSVEELLDLDSALEKLRQLDERQARVVELRFFAGLTVAEIALLLGLSKRSIEGDWTHARAWLERELAL